MKQIFLAYETGALRSQKLCDQRFFFFQLVDAGVNFPAAEVIQLWILTDLQRRAELFRADD